MPFQVPVYVSHELRLDGNMLGADLANEIFDALTIPNQEHIEAKQHGRWGWEKIPEFHEPFALDGDWLVLPRGYALQLKQKLRDHGIKVDWIDRTKWKRGDNIGPDHFSFRDHQPAAVKAIKRHRQGIYKAPTGSGKTVTVCGLIWELCPQRTLILVDRINLVNQWVRHIDGHLHPGFQIGHIGEGKWHERKRITIATVQSIWRARKMLGQDWFDKFDLVVLDECHHITANTFRDLISRFSARYRIGVSATPDKTGEFALAEAILGPVFHSVGHQALRDQGVLIKPEVRVLYSNFNHPYWGDHSADKDGDCEVPWCHNPKPHHRHRNNYQQVIKALVEDENRNGMIVDVLKYDGTSCTTLVCTDQTKHIKAIYEAIKHDGWLPLDDIYILTGKQSGEQRDQVLESVQRRKQGIILSTIANEALDLPAIDRIVLAYPTRNAKKIEQQVGRGTRSTAGKKDCIVYDITDPVGVLQQQLKSRMLGCYQPLELEVKIFNKPKKKKRQLERLGAA